MVVMETSRVFFEVRSYCVEGLVDLTLKNKSYELSSESV